MLKKRDRYEASCGHPIRLIEAQSQIMIMTTACSTFAVVGDMPNGHKSHQTSSKARGFLGRRLSQMRFAYAVVQDPTGDTTLVQKDHQKMLEISDDEIYKPKATTEDDV